MRPVSAVRVVHDPAAFVAVRPRADRLRHAVAADHADGNRSALVALLRCAKRNRNRSAIVPPAGSAIAGDWMDVNPPSTSLPPAVDVAVRPVIRQFTEPPSQVPGCSEMPFWLVGCGSPRCQRPVVAGF